MKANNIKLIVVLVVAIVGSGLCAKKLAAMQKDMQRSSSLSHASKLPIGGMQKFMADIIWMRFINFAGTNPLDETNKKAYKSYIDTIIALDPEFLEVYKWGTMFLQQEDIEMALDIVDKAQKHPRIRNNHELPLLAGQMLMRPEWNKYFAGHESDIDKERVRRARTYYHAAKSCPEATASCVSSFIRSGALLEANGLPRKINELRAWKDYFEKSMAADGMEMMEGEMMDANVDMEGRLLSQIKYLAEDYVIGSDTDKGGEVKNEANKKEAIKLINEVIDTFFPGRPFDPETFKPYKVSDMKNYQGTIVTLLPDKKYVVELDASNPFAIEHVSFKLAQGKAKVTVMITEVLPDGKLGEDKPIPGLTNVKVGTERTSVPKLKKQPTEEDAEKDDAQPTYVPTFGSASGHKVREALEQNKGKAGSIIKIKVTEAAGAEGLSYKIATFVGDYF